MNKSNFSLVSLVLRLSFASLFGVAAINKFVAGPEALHAQFEKMFANSWIPMSLVHLQGAIVPYIELALVVWLVFGVALRTAWLVSALFLMSLAIGLAAINNYAGAGQDYMYVFVCLIGLVIADSDEINFKKLKG